MVGGEVKVVPPVSNLPVSNLENPDEGQIDFLSTGISEAQLTRSSWLKKIDSAATGHLNISVSPKDDLPPGFYTVTGILAQVAN